MPTLWQVQRFPISQPEPCVERLGKISSKRKVEVEVDHAGTAAVSAD